jgi:hypothetical protein
MRSKKAWRGKKGGFRFPQGSISRGSRYLTAGQNSTYTVEFKPTPQIFTSTNSNPQGIVSSAAALPINGPTTGTPSCIKSWPSTFSATGKDWSFGVQFTLQDLFYASSFGLMFDMYRIDEVAMEVQWLQNQAVSGALVSAPTMTVAYDLDDTASPQNVGGVLQHPGAQRHNFGDKSSVTYKVKPRIFSATTSGGGGATNGATMLPVGGFVNTANQTVPYYGLKAYLTDIFTALGPDPDQQSQGFRISFTYKVTFKGQKIAR